MAAAAAGAGAGSGGSSWLKVRRSGLGPGR
jgi:hypothetical protein